MSKNQLQVEDIFDEVLRRAPGTECADYLDETCGEDADLKRRVERLLQAVAEAGSFLESPAQDPSPTVDRPLIEAIGTQIGPYKLLQQIGEGGMGTVFMAEQTEPVKRLVALKLIKPGMDSRQVIARFEAERQALALMDHPNIARVLDAGTTVSGRPYFVMDLVKGVPITKYCDEHHLTPRQRLELFIPVCQAVQHAHQKGIIHRDLKPSNVLVALYDGKPVPKVIDFGVAKAAGHSLTEKTLVTGFGNLVGTLEYMSPEQAEVNQLDIDTRSDIYALGVLLYELLAGSPPFSRKELEQAGMLEMLRVIREQEPSRPSTKLSSSDALPTLSANRSTEPAKLTRLVRGELDWIVMKALEKDRDRRYETANGFAMDVLRYLADEAVLACPPSAGYRLRKFVRRNKGRVLAAAALALSLLAGVAAVLTVKAQATWERNAAQIERVARDARTTANVASAVRDAREHVEEAWKLPDFPERMQHATDVALAALRRAEDVTSGGTPDETTLSDLASVRLEVDQLARHTRLINARAANTQEFAEEATGQDWAEPQARFSLRSGEAFREFGLDPVHNPADEVAKAVASSRVHDILLGMLLDWHWHSRGEERPCLERVIRSARRRSGGAYARWQELRDANDVSGLVAFAASPDGLSFGPILTGAVFRDLRDAKQYAACQTFLCAAIERYPYEPWFNFDLADICQKIQPPQYVEALRHSSAATALRPDSAVCHLQLGDCYADLRSYDQAVAAYRRSISLGRGNTVGYIHLGIALAKKEDGDGAIAAFSKAIEIDPKLDTNRVARGEALCRMGRFREAIADFELATELAPNDLKAWYEAAALYLYVGDVERYRRACREMLDRFEQRAGEYASIPEQTAKTCALAPDAVSDFARIERLAQRAVTGTEKHRWYRNFVLAKGLTDYRGGHHEQTLEWLERFAPKPGGNVWDATAFAALCMAHHRLGHAEQARAALLSARALLAKKKPDAQLFDWLHCEILYREAEGLMGPVTPQELAAEAPVDENRAPSPKK